MKSAYIILLCTLLLYPGSRAQAFSVYHWSELRYPNSEQVEDRYNALIEGAFQYNFTVKEFNDQWSFHLQSNFDYSIDSEAYSYNNRLRPEWELKFRYRQSGWQIEPGLRVLYEYRTEEREGETQWQMFLFWYKGWRGSFGDFDQIRFGGNVWGEVRTPSGITPLESENSLLETQVEQAISRYSCATNRPLEHYLRVKLVADSDDLPWNNKVTTSIGTRCSFPILDNHLLQIGLQYNYDHRWENSSQRDRSDTILLLNWSYWR